MMLRALSAVSAFAVLVACSTNPLEPNAEVRKPKCNNPAPLLGTYDSRARGFIVKLRDSTETRAQVGRLAQSHGFVSLILFESFGMFAAEMTPATVASLRCQPSVDSVNFNGVFTFG